MILFIQYFSILVFKISQTPEFALFAGKWKKIFSNFFEDLGVSLSRKIPISILFAIECILIRECSKTVNFVHIID